MGAEKANLRWGVEQRYEFIEFRLFWEGRVNRGHLMDTFGVSVNQASADLNRYIGLAPGNMAYDKSARTYVCGDGFEPLFLKPDAGRYLSQIKAVAEGTLSRSDAWVDTSLPFDVAPVLVRSASAEMLRKVLAAVRDAEAIEIKYRSIFRPEPRWCWIAPHAIGFDGARWHARAFCLNDERFKDFSFSRIMEIRGTRPSGIDPSADIDWAEEVTLEIGPHPELSSTQRNLVAVDYGMREGKLRIPVRKALLCYVIQRLGLVQGSTARSTAGHVRRQRIVLLNADELRTQMPEGVVGTEWSQKA